jgi:molecular chaperone GrpE
VTDAQRQDTPDRTADEVASADALETGPADVADAPADAAPPQADGSPAGEDTAPAPLPGDDEHVDLVAVAAADSRSKAELLGELFEAEHKRDEYLDDLRRSHAELENFRKRVLRDSAAQRDHGRADVAQALLEVLDDLDRTLEAAKGSDDRGLAKGVDLVATKLSDALGSIGLQRIDGVEVTFDPTVHEAVQQLPADEPTDEPLVAQVLRPGYRLGDRTLRAAMVVVRG